MNYIFTFNENSNIMEWNKTSNKNFRNIKIFETFNFNYFYNFNLKKNFLIEDEENFLIIYGNIFSIDNIEIQKNEEINKVVFQLLKKKSFEYVLKKIEGDCSLIFFSKKKKNLYFSRDLFGVSPLYFFKNKQKLVISSKPSLIFNYGFTANLVRKEYLYRYAGLHYRLIDNNPHISPFKNIEQLPASKYAKYNLVSQKLDIIQYWNLEKTSLTTSTNERELSEIYLEILKESVKKRVSKKGKKIFSISGGLDSSSILCLASDALNEKVDSYSVTYDDQEYDERSEIQDITSLRSKKWHNFEIKTKLDLEKKLSRMIEINDEPIVTATWYTHFLATEKIKSKNYNLIYGGLGGDEFNAGEYEYFTFFFADCLKNKKDFLSTEIEFWEKYHNHKVFKKNKRIALDSINKFTDLKKSGLCKIDYKRSFKYLDCLSKKKFNDIKLDYDLHCPFESYLNNRTFHDLFYETLPCCLRAQHRHHSFFDMETINPFLDRKVAEFMFGIPYHLKIKNGVTKHLLRLSMKNILPETTRTRIKKTGWNAPAHLWFTGRNLEFVRDELVSKKFADKEIYNVKNVLRILNDHESIIKKKSNKENHMMFIWQLVNLILWNKQVTF